MKYNIYKDIDEREFNLMKEKLKKIEVISSPLMQTNDFYLNRDSYQDVLALDYQRKDDKFFGNIGLKVYERDSKKPRVFEFYITKSYDEHDHRFYKKVIGNKYSLDEAYENVHQIFNECLLIYENLKENELWEKIKIRK